MSKDTRTPSEIPAGIPEGGTDSEIAIRIKNKLLNRIDHIIDHAPEGLVTEVQYKASGMTYKLTDLVASYKNIVGKTPIEDENPDEGFDFLENGD